MKKLNILLLLVSGLISAQITTSSISGVVVDDANMELEGANVVAVHVPTGTTYGVVTNQDGRFNMVNMRVGGPYTVTISYIGFNQQNVEDVYLTLGKSETISLTMTPDSQELDDVVVTASASDVFSSDRTGAQTSVGRRQLSTLPSISRSAADYTRLEPTASNGSFGGRNDQFNNYSLDGAIFNNPFGLDAATPGGQTEAQPISIDAIEQITVSTAPYDVTQAGFTGASVNAVTKSGTNEFTGTVYGFYRNEDMTGSKIKGQSIFVPKLLQSQTGVSIGGPIIKNKLFFFANFEQDNREDLGQSWLPNRGTGGINESRVAESDLIAVQSALSGLGYDTGTYEGFIHEAGSTKGIVKLDWNINDNHRMALIYNFLDASKDKPAHPTALGFRGPNASILQFEKSGYQINNKLNSLQMELNSSLSGSVSNKLQFGYTHFDDFRNPMSTAAPSVIIEDGASANYIIVGHEPFSINNRLDQKVIQMTNNLTYIKGDHTYTLGFSYEKFEFDNSFNLGFYGGTFGFDIDGDGGSRNFASVQEFLDNAGSGGLIDTTIGAAIATKEALDGSDGWSLAETNVGQMAFYLQDEWFVNDKFKLTYGLRMDKPLYFDTDEKAQEVIDGTGDYAPGTPYVNPNTGQVQLLDNTKMPSDKWVISPRLGFNYDVNGDDTTQVRGGSGLFTGRFPFVWLGNQIGNPNWWFHQMVDPDYQFPQVWRTNLGIDQEYDNGLTLSLDVSYTKDVNGPQVQNWGFKTPSGTLLGVDNRAVYTANDFVQVDVPFPANASAYVFSNSDLGRIWNYSLKLQKTFDSGLYTSLAYNHLNAKDVNSIEAEITGDAFDFNPVVGDANAENLSYSKYGDMHRIVGVASQSWNYGINNRWGSTITTFFEYNRGGRYSYTYAGDINGDGRGGNDLLYVPTNSQLFQMNFADPTHASAYNAFIEQDEYLKSRRGQYAERYGALSPWTSRWDVRFLQDYRIQRSSGKTNVIQFSMDILNFGNLISSDWGLVQQPSSIQPVGVTVTEGVPSYTFDSNLVDSFVYDSSLQSRWQMQFGLRYIF